MVALVKMTESGYGHFAVTLLRPAYEEMIWLSYLRKQGAVSKELVVLLMQQELCDNLDAQNEYLGIKQMSNVGFSQIFIKSMLIKNKIHTMRLKEIGKSLDWREGSTLPSVAYLARAVDREKQYKYLYQGTSRYVHFSMQENMRRVWGQKGKVTIASSTFASYWSAFALSWGARIFFDVILTAHGVLDDFEMTQDDEIAFGKWIESLPHVPIVTPEKLKYWSQKNLVRLKANYIC